MNYQKSLLTVIGEWCDQEQANRLASSHVSPPRRLASWLPSRGNVVFTLAMIALLIAAQSVGALPLARHQSVPSAASTGTIAYQGRLADSSGAPITGTYNMIFRLYDAASGGAPLWEEQWTGSNGVRVSDGLFNVMLGSLTSMPQDIIAGHDQLFLGITVGTDDEMAPRVQLGSVPFAVQALTVPDGSVTTAKIADGAVTQAKLATDVLIPLVPRVLKFVSKQNDLTPSCSSSGTTHVIETVAFTLPSPAVGYRWDLEWRFNQRFGAMYQNSLVTSFLLDGAPVKDATGTAFAENMSLSMQYSPTDNTTYGGMVYQNNVAPGEHTLAWRMTCVGDNDTFLVRQRWLVLTAVLVPQSF